MKNNIQILHYIKALPALLMLLFLCDIGWGQNANQYSFTTGTGASLLSPSWTTLISSGNDNYASALTSIGFNFVYEGTTYTQFSVNSNGLMRLGGTVVGTTSSNSFTSASNQPKIMPIWDDLSTASNGGVKYGVSGSAPNRILVVNYQLSYDKSTIYSYDLECQVWLYETTNEIRFVYSTGTLSGNTFSCGIGGATETNYESVTTSKHTISIFTENNSNSSWPGSGRYYSFIPPCASPSTIWSDNFEGDDSWTKSYFTIDAPAAGNTCLSANSATKVLCTINNGNYGSYKTEANSYAISPVINCSSYSSGITLSFYSYSQFEGECACDYGYVYVSGNNGSSYTKVETYTDKETGWTPHSIDITSIAAGKSQVLIKFTMTSDAYTSYTGWNIDDISVTGCSSCSAPTLAASSSPSSICTGGSVTLSFGSSGGSGCSGSWEYAWYTGDGDGNTYYNGTTWTNAANYSSSWSSITASPTSTTTYKVKVRCSTNTSCNATDATGTTVTVNASMNYGTVASGDQTICSGVTPNSMSVSGATGSGSFAYQWYSKAGSVSCPTGSSTTDWTSLGSSNGANTATYTPASGITSTTTYACFVTPGGSPTCGTAQWASSCRVVTVNSAPSAPTISITESSGTANNDGITCTSASVTLTSSSATSYSWSASAATTQSITVTPASTTTYTVTITSGGCTNSASQAITVNALPQGSLAGNTICSGGTGQFTYTSSAGTGPFSLIISGTTYSSITSGVAFNANPNPSSTTAYTLTSITDANGCARTSEITGASATITVISTTNTITLTSAGGTNAQTVCINTAITNITYTTTGATGATVTGLPTGVSGSWSSNTVTISGTPSASGTYTYTVTLSGGCGGGTATGTITVTAANTTTLTSAAGTNAQTVDINTAITNITYTTTGATGATVTGLPTGVSGSWSSNTVTISGTPSVSGTYTYTITTSGGCSNTTTGTITVNPGCTAPTNLASSSSSVTQTSAVITWTAANPAPSSGYNIYYSTSESAPTGGTIPSASVGAGITTYTIGGLTPNATYYVWVRSNCGSGSYSSWTSSINFTCNSCGGYYYRSIKSSGYWSISYTGTWERSSNGSSWNSTNETPTSSNCCCARIQKGHTITLNANITAPNTIIDAGGTLAISNKAITYGSEYTLTNNGTIEVDAGGSGYDWDGAGLIIDGTGTFINNGALTINTEGVVSLSPTTKGAELINYGKIDNYGGNFWKSQECDVFIEIIYGGINIHYLTLSSKVTNYGTITNPGHYYYAKSGSKYYFRGVMKFYNLDNYGTIANGSSAIDKCSFGAIFFYSGTFNNYSDGTVNNRSWMNFGSYSPVTGKYYPATYNNHGTHNDYAIITFDYGSTFNNKRGANFNIASTGGLQFQGLVTVTGTNDGTITNSSSSTTFISAGIKIFTNSSFTNNNLIYNEYKLSNLGTFTNNHIIYDEGEIYNDGTFTNTTASQFIYRQTSGSITGKNELRYEGNALLKYNGTSAQTTSSYEFPSDQAYCPNYIEIDNSSVASNGVTLHASRTINNNTKNPPDKGVPYLTLTNGAFKLNSKTLTINSSSASAIARDGTTQTGYIVSETLDDNSKTSSATPRNGCTSRIQWNDLGTNASESEREYTFPFGTTDGTYIPLIANVTALASGPNGYFIAATYPTSNENYPYPKYPETVTNMNNKYGDNSSNAVDRFYLTSFKSYTSNPTVTYTFSYDESNDLDGISESSLYAQYWNSSSSEWERPGTGTADHTNNQVNSVSGINASRVWVLSNSSNPLPVELLYFTASCKNRNIFFKWATASETNNDYFLIEKKINNNWKKITKVNGNGNTNYISEYTAFDINPSQNTLNGSETSYYRLKQIDYNGNYEAFEPIPITCDEDKMYDYFNAYLDENKNILVSFSSDNANQYTITLIDHYGKKVKEITGDALEGMNTATLSASDLSKEIYLVVLMKDNEHKIKKILVQ